MRTGALIAGTMAAERPGWKIISCGDPFRPCIVVRLEGRLMDDADRDQMLRDMAENRGLRLVKSRRRKPGGDHGRFGLKDKATGKEMFGFGKDGLTATPEEIEQHLREFMVSDWKSSLKQAAEAPKPES